MTMMSFATARNPAAVESILISAVGRFTLDSLIDSSRRQQGREVQRLKLHRAQQEEREKIKYADQAVLANLGWGIDALEEAIHTNTVETKIARLEYAEQMLQVCALLEGGDGTTAGISNSYLAASAHLNLALVCKMRNDDKGAVKHVLEMFISDPMCSRVEFAPELWETLFQPHLTGIMSWYCEQRVKLSVEAPGISENVDFSCSRDDFSMFSYEEPACNVNRLSKVTPEQTAQLQVLERLYESSLDDHTRQYAKYYKDWLTFGLDPASQRKVGPLMPIAEPPTTPLRQVFVDDIQHKPQLEIIPEVEGDEDRDDKPMDGKNKVSPDFYQENDESSSNRRMEHSLQKTKEQLLADYGEIANSSSFRKINEQITDESVRPKRPASRSSSFSTSSDYSKSGGNSKLTQVSKTPSFSKSGFSKQLLEKVCNSNTSSPKYGSPTKSSNASSPKLESPSRSRNLKKLKSLERIPSKRLLDILREDNVHQPTAQAKMSGTSAASSGYVTEAESDTEMKGGKPTKYHSIVIVPNKSQELLRSSSGSSRTTSEVDFDGSTYGSRKIRPPKDFVCPITNQLFDDPVTLETGQTYERTAIQEWLQRGNTTCPITRQPLKSRILPRTNYVLKRLVENWRELHSANESPLYDATSDYYQEDKSGSLVHSPSSVISACSSRFLKGGNSNDDALWPVDDLFYELKTPVECLCVSENLQECEDAVMTIAAIWEKAGGDYRVEASLTKATVIEGLIEVLTASVSNKVQNAAVCILSTLVVSDEFTRHTILRADPKLESITRLLKNKVTAAVILLYHLKLSANELDVLNLVGDLVSIVSIELENEGAENCTLSPKAAAVILLQQLVSIRPERSHSNAHSVIALEALPTLGENLKTKDLDERLSIVTILLCCMRADGRCRNIIARSSQLGFIVDVLIEGSGSARTLVTSFFLELVHSNRRTSNNQVLRTVSAEGILSTKHALLVHLQKAPSDHKHTLAVLLLQLELLDETRHYSFYTEEAVHAIITALHSQSSDCQLETLEALIALVGRFSSHGVPMTEAWLLKAAGLQQAYDILMKEPEAEHDINHAEEDRAAKQWEINVAKVLLDCEEGGIFEAIGALLQCKNLELSRPSMIVAVWLCQMVQLLPDIGIRALSRRYFLAPLVVTLESAKHSQQRALAALGLHTFLNDPESFQELICYARDVIKPLRQLKKVTWVAQEFIEAFIRNSSLNPTDLWQHGEIGLLDTSRCGEVKALARSKGRLFSGHSDGSIQVWETKKKLPTLFVVLKEHSKAVTSLTIPVSSNKLYSSSLDKTIRVWTIAPDSIHCTHAVDIKEAVLGLAVTGSTIAINTQGTSIKLQAENLPIKQVNLGRYVQCLTSSSGNIYCGCTDHSIQEVNVEEGSVVTIQPGMRTLLGKKPIYSIQVFKTEVFTAGTPVEGAAVKVWDQTDYTLKRSLPISQEIRAIAVNDDFLYLGSTSGCVEVWLKERNIRVSLVSTGSRVNALCLDGDFLYSGCEDGKIRVISFF